MDLSSNTNFYKYYKIIVNTFNTGVGNLKTLIISATQLIPDIKTAEQVWQQIVADYGVCGKFVYDSVNNTVRLPKYSDKIWSGNGVASVKGNGVTLGLTDGTNNYGLRQDTSNYIALSSGTAIYGTNVGDVASYGNTPNDTTLGITTDSSKSGIITDFSTLTTSLDGYWYIVIATSTKTQVEVDIDEITTDLNGKADTDLSNVLQNIDFVVASQLPTAQNNYTWYRKYKSGWVEQGGYHNDIGGASVTIPLPVEMSDTNYVALRTLNGSFSTSGWGFNCWSIDSKTTTSITYFAPAHGLYSSWEVKGMMANS